MALVKVVRPPTLKSSHADEPQTRRAWIRKLAWMDEVGGIGDVGALGSTLKDLQVQEPYE